MSDYEKLKQIIDEIPNLIAANIDSSDPKFKAWEAKTERFLIRAFGEGSYEHERFKQTEFSVHWVTFETPETAFVEICQSGLKECQAVFQTYLDEMKDEKVSASSVSQKQDFTKLFIVHGHDGELKESVARIIEKQGIEAIILSEKANRGKTIIEKIETYSDVGGAICLFTADDIGKEKNEPGEQPRARQNVVLETGFFMGKLGRNHVVLLADKGIEMPSDLSGIVYTDLRNWETDLLKELKAMGYAIDFNKLF